jgi:hypothetical protein
MLLDTVIYLYYVTRRGSILYRVARYGSILYYVIKYGSILALYY